MWLFKNCIVVTYHKNILISITKYDPQTKIYSLKKEKIFNEPYVYSRLKILDYSNSFSILTFLYNLLSTNQRLWAFSTIPCLFFYYWIRLQEYWSEQVKTISERETSQLIRLYLWFFTITVTAAKIEAACRDLTDGLMT